MSRSTPEIAALMAAHSMAVAADISAPLARFLREARDLCDGDLDKALVMVEIILRANQHPDFRTYKAGPSEVTSGAVFPSLGTNVRSLADATGIPKESVRRKVLELIEAGWVIRDGRTLQYSLQGYHAIAPARDALYRMCACAYVVVDGLLEQPAAADEAAPDCAQKVAAPA